MNNLEGELNLEIPVIRGRRKRKLAVSIQRRSNDNGKEARARRIQILRNKRCRGQRRPETVDIIHGNSLTAGCGDVNSVNCIPTIRRTEISRPILSDITNIAGGVSTFRRGSVNEAPGSISGSHAPTISELPAYEDLGDRDCVCAYCKARFWLNERLHKDNPDCSPKFGMCCLQGKIRLPTIKEPAQYLKDLLTNGSPRCVEFRQNIRIYNSMFAFTSMGGRIDPETSTTRGPFVYRMSGQNMHMIGSMLPVDGRTPRYAQLYIYDTEHEISHRLSVVNSHTNHRQHVVNQDTVRGLQHMLDRDNRLVRIFRMARDFVATNEGQSIGIKLIHKRGTDPNRYNIPSAPNEVAALIVGDIGSTDEGRDIIVKYKSGLLERIKETHPDFLALQYPLLFPFGDGGYNENIPHVHVDEASTSRVKCVSMREYFAYVVHERDCEFSTILRSGKLFQQFVVDAYTMMEAYRLQYLRYNQKLLRAEMYKGLTDAIFVGETEAAARGKRIILPSSFTGGPRYIMRNYQDAIAICGWAGYPDLFITFTCNPKWPEITRAVSSSGSRVENRPDLISKVFKMKLDCLMKELKKGSLFGPVKASICTIEFQKRGLPHAHILLFLGNTNKLSTPKEIDDVISAELPDKENNPTLFEAVSNFMMHGPCGVANRNSPCMKDGRCSKYFPKNYTAETFIHEDGYVRYRRRDNGREVLKGGIPLDNRHVIPYNPYLLLKYQAHINVERCKQGESIKYLFKYVSKGHDRATVAFYADSGLSDPNMVHDEIKMYYDVRYLSPCEAIWRILSHDINYRYPSVERLAFHLPDQQNVIYEDDDNIEEVVNRPTVRESMFLAWMTANDEYDEARVLTYAEFPTKFVFKKHLQKWTPRKSGFSIGRLYYVPPGVGESFYLRLLLTSVRGPKSYKEIRTVDGVEYNNFRDACYALGLLEDDREYIDAFREAAEWASTEYVRRLFCTLLSCNSFGRPEIVWQQSWKLMSDDILYTHEQETGLTLTDKELENAVLTEIERLLNVNGRSLNEYDSMPSPSSPDFHGRTNRYMYDELNFDWHALRREVPELVANLTEEQREIYDAVISAVNISDGGLYFVYGYGGTGKTYLWKTLSTSLRGDGKIVLTVATSGIAALLLPRGKTAHSQFAIPLNINEDSVCNIKQGSHLAELLIHTSLIIWDEAPMANRFCFEALDRTLKDICSRVNPDASELVFGGKVVVLGGDFRQILPVIPRGSREDIVMATINASYLWQYCKVFKLTKNMRLMNSNMTGHNMDTKDFADWIVAMGDGKVPIINGTTDIITIPDEFLLCPTSSPLECIVHSTYPDLLDHLGDGDYFKDRAILAPSLTVVEEVNNYMINMLPGDERLYLSADSVSRQDVLRDSIAAMHSVEFLNTISMSGIPNHQLRLKVGCPIMLMRNLDKSIGLCNGTRLILTRLERHVIQAKIMTGVNVGLKVLIPRITLSPSDTSLPFTLCRRQFPIMPSFAMTINKSQGQSLMSVGLYLPRPVFTHGQLYVAISRVTKKDGLKMLLLDSADKVTNQTANVVYNEVFCNVVN